MKKLPKNKLSKDEKGVVSILLTVFVLLVLSLLVLAYAQASRREQRQALDSQLANDAYQAAESGINATITDIRNGTISESESKRDSCSGSESDVKNLENTGAIAISCVLFDRAPETLEWSSVDISKGEFVSLRTLGDNLKKLTFSWNSVDGGGDYSGCNDSTSVTDFPKDTEYSANCNAGMLRVMLIPVSNGKFDRNDLINETYTVFLRPTTNGNGQTTYIPYGGGGPNNQGNVIAASCPSGTADRSQRCTASIGGLPTGGSIFMLVRSVYGKNTLTVSGTDSGGNAVRFNQAQIKIDSTGRAGDILKRLQVRVPLYQKYVTTNFAIESLDGICKQISTYPNVASSQGGAVSSKTANDNCGGLN